MKLAKFGQTGLHVSPLGFGGAPVGFLEESLAKTRNLLNYLLDSGLNLIDTAACYPNSERLIGEVVGHRRSDFFLVTKCGHKAEGLTGEEWSPELIRRSVERSLKELKTDYLDIVLLHSCEEKVLREGTAMEALVRLREEGKALGVGYSGDNESAAFAASLPEVSALELSVNLFDQANLAKVLPAAREHDLGVLAKRPLGNAAWKGQSGQRGIYRDYVAPYVRRMAEMGLTLEAIGVEGEPDKVWPEVALRFCLSVPGVHCAIVGTTSRKNAEANLRAVGKGPLPEETVQMIQDSFSSASIKTDSVWIGLT